MEETIVSVYLFTDPKEKFFKIGAAQNPELRKAGIPVPFYLHTLAVIPIGTRLEAERVEKKLHWFYREKWIDAAQGKEWFENINTEEFKLKAEQFKTDWMIPNDDSKHKPPRAEHNYLTPSEYGLWAYYREIENDKHQVSEVADATVQVFNVERCAVYRLRQRLLKKGWLRIIREQSRDAENGQLTPTVLEVIRLKQWLTKPQAKSQRKRNLTAIRVRKFRQRRKV